MPIRIKYLKKENGMQRGSLSIRSWRTQCDWGYSLAVMTQTAKEYLACSWQLTADGFYPHTGFPHHGNRSFTFVQDDALLLVSLWCFPLPIVSNAFPQSSFRTGVRMLCEKDGKRQHDNEWRIYSLDDILPFSSQRQEILRYDVWCSSLFSSSL